MFERTFLDLDATRTHVAADLHVRLGEIEAHAHDAEREVAGLTAKLARIEHDYLTAELPAAEYLRLKDRLTDNLTAANSELERLRANETAVRRSRAELDAEGETLTRLAELRVAVLGRKRTAEQAQDIASLRGAMAQVFPVVYVASWSQPGAVTLYLDAAQLLSEGDPGRVGIPLRQRETIMRGTGVAL
jgi:hypothetical protein